MIGEVFIHQLDVLRWLLGPLEIVAARALHTEPDIAGETLATILLQTTDGAPVMLSGSFVAPGFGTAVSDRLELIGSRGSILFAGGILDLLGEVTERVSFDIEAGYQACFDGAIGHFVTSLRSGAPFETDAVENLETLRLVEAAYQAAR